MVYQVNSMFEIVKKNPKMVFLGNGENKTDLTKIKLSFLYGTSCVKCGMKASFFITRDETSKMFGLTEYGCQIELHTINKRTICNICKTI